MKSACNYPLSSAKPARKPASFEEPVSETRCFYLFAIRCFPACGCTASRWSECRSWTAKKSSHPWHFRCWSPSRNDLECTNLVHWTEALHRFSSRDAIIVVGSALEKHFDGDFTQNQEKEITFKRWPPGYQSWKLCLALNGLIFLKSFVYTPSTPCRDVKFCSNIPLGDLSWKSLTEVMWRHHSKFSRLDRRETRNCS